MKRDQRREREGAKGKKNSSRGGEVEGEEKREGGRQEA